MDKFELLLSHSKYFKIEIKPKFFYIKPFILKYVPSTEVLKDSNIKSCQPETSWNCWCGNNKC